MMIGQAFYIIAMLLMCAGNAWAAPNFVVILADDLDYGEVGARHVGDVPTPNIDAIARAGVTFTGGYVTANLSVPSRAGPLTGRYQQEFGIYGNPARPYPTGFGLPASHTTLAEALNANPAVVSDLRQAREAWKRGLAPALW